MDGILATAIKTVDDQIRTLSGPPQAADRAAAPPSPASLIPDGTELAQQPLSLLDKEIARLRKLIGIDVQNAKALTRLSEKISRDEPPWPSSRAISKPPRRRRTGSRN